MNIAQSLYNQATESSTYFFGPGHAGGNPALGGEDLDNTMRMIFYPAIIGWTLLSFWIASLSYRVMRLHERFMEGEE